MLNGLTTIVVLGLTFALWGLYHKIFNVVYFHAPVALLREFVICLVIACAIIAGVTSPIRSFLHPDKTEQFCGVFFNTELLNGSEFNSSILIEKSDQVKGGIQITGFASKIGVSDAAEVGEYDIDSFTQDIPCPDSNTFSFEVPRRDSTYEEYTINYTIKINPKKETLSVVEETDRTDFPAPFTGDYVGSDAWDKLLPKRQAAENAITELYAPNTWVSDYFGVYLPRSFAEGTDQSNCLSIVLGPMDGEDAPEFLLQCYSGSRLEWAGGNSFVIPYPQGANVPTTHIEYDCSDYSFQGLIAFDAKGQTADGKKIIEITDFPIEWYIGEYVQVEGDPLPDLCLWDGTYICDENDDYYTYEGGGIDTQKNITIRKIDDTTLSARLSCLDGDGYEQHLDITLQIEEFENQKRRASDGDFSFLLYYDNFEGCYEISVSQSNFYDMDFSGTYLKQNAVSIG